MKILSTNLSYKPIRYENNLKKNQNSKVNFTGIYSDMLKSTYDVDIIRYLERFENDLMRNKDKIYEYLDSNTILYNDKEQTITEHLRDMFDLDTTEYNSSGTLLHKTSRPQEIIQNGFDVNKINITNFGPGIYFSQSEGELTIYSGETMKADFEGSVCYGKNLDRYNAINSHATNLIRKMMKQKFEFGPTTMAEQEVLRKFVHEYSRRKIAEDLGIDASYNRGGQYFIVFNPEKLSNIRIQNMY